MSKKIRNQTLQEVLDALPEEQGETGARVVDEITDIIKKMMV